MTSTIDFYKTDFSATLYPLRTNLLMIENHENDLSKYIYQEILDDSKENENFLSQQRVFATKPEGHLRRTVKLDPVAEYFIYDVIYRNRAIFRDKVSDHRKSFGYRFKGGTHIPIHIAYKEYKECLTIATAKFKHNIKFDIASYFNSIYHHDISHWFASKDLVSKIDNEAIGKFFREINAGRSVDFLPHGIYPCKMIGNEYLKFIDLSGVLKSQEIIRFMDDFALFDNDEKIIKQDFIRIQQLLGSYGLNINPSKTIYNNKFGDVQETLTDIRKSLKEIIHKEIEIYTTSTVEIAEIETIIEKNLSKEQIDSLLSLLKNDQLEESDADLILGFLRSHSDSILEYLPLLLGKFPNLIKHIHSICASVVNKKALTNIILAYIKSDSHFLEYQLFWLGVIVEDFLIGQPGYGDVLFRIYELTADFKIARAKILEIPEQGFGFKEIRNEYLKTGQSDWLSWASAMGTRNLKAAERNYALDYFSKASRMNFLIASCVKKL